MEIHFCPDFDRIVILKEGFADRSSVMMDTGGAAEPSNLTAEESIRNMPVELNESLSVLISTEAIQEKIDELAAQIVADYGEEPLLLLGVLKGSLHFISDLGRRLSHNTTVDFVQVSSYGTGKSTTGVVQIRKDLDVNIEGLNVLIVEDIVDTGTTLSHLRELLNTRRPKSLRVVALLSKPQARRHQTQVEYVGFEIPNEFVVGYGLDYGERYRNLPYIAILHEG